jgi:hypothetical protein
MYMNPKRLHELARRETPTVRVCYHGIHVIHECNHGSSDDCPVFTVRFLGHLVDENFNEEDRATTDVVPEHREFTMDIDMSPDLVRSIAGSFAEIAGQATACEMLQEIPSDLSGLPDFFRKLFGDEDDDENGESI